MQPQSYSAMRGGGPRSSTRRPTALIRFTTILLAFGMVFGVQQQVSAIPHPVTVTVSLDKSAGPVGSVVTATLSGGIGACWIQFVDTNGIAQSYDYNDCIEGAMTMTFPVPAVAVGTYEVDFCDSGCNGGGYTSFTVSPNNITSDYVTLNPATGPGGTSVTAIGTAGKWKPFANIHMQCAFPDDVDTYATVNNAGGFTLSFVVPLDADVGSYWDGYCFFQDDQGIGGTGVTVHFLVTSGGGGGPPPTPTNLHVTGVTSSSVSFAWTPPDNTSNIAVSNGYVVTNLAPGGSAYTQTGMASGAWVCVQVQAWSNYGASAWTSWVCGTATGLPPPTPTNLHVTGATTSSVSFGWNPPDGTSLIAVSNGTQVTNLGAAASAYTQTGLSPGGWVCLSVLAYSPGGVSPWSGWVCGDTIPATPTNIHVTGTTGSSVSFAWTPGDPNSAIALSNGIQAFAMGNDASTYTESGMTSGSWVCVIVAAYNYSGASPWSSPWVCGQAGATTVPPAAPTDLHVTSVTADTFNYAWTNPAGTAGVYITNGDSTYDLGAASPGPYSVYWPGWPPNHYMCFAVAVYNSAGYSPWTPYVCGTTLSSGPEVAPPSGAKKVPSGPSTVPSKPPTAPQPTPAPGAGKPTGKPSGKP